MKDQSKVATGRSKLKVLYLTKHQRNMLYINRETKRFKRKKMGKKGLRCPTNLGIYFSTVTVPRNRINVGPGEGQREST